MKQPNISTFKESFPSWKTEQFIVNYMSLPDLQSKSDLCFENHNQVKRCETFKILSRVFTRQCEVKDTADADPEIIIKEKPDKDTICAPHNPEARYVRRGKQRVTGDKAFVTETCSSENKTQFITDIELLTATASDSDQQPEIRQRLIDNNFKAEKQYEDAGFVKGKTILKVSELTRADGMRKSRHKDRNRTGLQLILATLACNVKRFIRHGQQYGYLEPAVQVCR